MKELLIALGSHSSDTDCQTGCEGYSEHSLRPCLLFLKQSPYTQTHCISTSRSLRLQYPLFCFEDVGKNIDCLWWNVIVVSLSGRIRKRRVMRQDGRWWMRRRRKVLLMGGICHRMQSWNWARLSRVARNPPKSGTSRIVCESIRSSSPRLQQRPLWHVNTCGGWQSVYFHFVEWANAGEERWEEEIRRQGSWSGLFFWKNVKTHFSHCSQLM